MKEIGGYLEFEQLISNEYYKDLLRLNTGRNALIYLMKARNIKKIYIPYYLCESVYEILKKYNYEYEFYKIKDDFLPDFSKELPEDEYLYIVNYYGQINNKTINKLKEKYKNIILDNTHSFFQEPIENIDTIYNCRKWFGVSDGAYLSTNCILNKELKKDSSKDRMKHLLGRYEENASSYYKYFKENDMKFKEEPLKEMSNLTQNLMGAIDYEKIKKIRNVNYEYLHQNLKDINKLKLNEPEVAFCYPLYLENIDTESLKKKLAEQKIYIPTLWPNVLEEVSQDSIEYKYVKNILPIPCDQRYDEKDMERIVFELKKRVENERTFI